MQIRKLIIIIIIFSMLATTVYAVPGNGKGQGQMNGPGNSGKTKMQEYFNDLEGYDWASSYIRTMAKKNVVKGMGNGKYAPASAAKEIEAIIMILRIMGYEDDLSSEPVEGLRLPGNSGWMLPYIATAIEQGVIDEDEIGNFNPNRPATRAKVALYIVNALGEDFIEDAEEALGIDLDYLDEEEIPLKLKGYVYLVKKFGLMIGYGGKFHPNKPITRAEMAVLLSRLSDSVDTDYSYTTIGKVSDVNIYDETVTIRRNGSNIKFDLSDDTDVILDGDTYTDIEYLGTGMWVRLHITDDEVVQIDVLRTDEDDEKIFERIEGELKDFDLTSDPKTVDIEIDSTTEETFELKGNARIYIDGEEGKLSSGLKGNDVIAYLYNELIYKLLIED